MITDVWFLKLTLSNNTSMKNIDIYEMPTSTAERSAEI